MPPVTLRDFGVESPAPKKAGHLTVSFEAIAHMLGLHQLGDIRTIEVDNATQTITIHMWGEKLKAAPEGQQAQEIYIDKDGTYKQTDHSQPIMWRDGWQVINAAPMRLGQDVVYGGTFATGTTTSGGVGTTTGLRQWMQLR